MSARNPNRDNADSLLPKGTLRYLSELAVGILLFCITVHTFFLAGLIVPVTVSAGSMAKTILGPRREVKCPACGIIIACGHERMPRSGTAYCSNCGTVNIDLTQGRDVPGEHAIIDRASLAINPPHRWEVIVFRCPDIPGQFCIKRVVGLPGEEIELKEGDVYVNGEIARKTLEQCREVAQLVHDASYDFYDPRPDAQSCGWLPSEANSDWSLHPEREPMFDLKAEEKSASKLQWLAFHPCESGPVTDDSDYNQSESRRLNPVRDLMLSCTIGLREADEFYIRTTLDNDPFELTFSVADQRIRLARGEEKIAESSVKIPAGFTLEVIRFDHQFLVAINHRLVLQYGYQPRSKLVAKPVVSATPWAIGMRTGSMRLSELKLLRDIYYTVPTSSRYAWGAGKSVTLAEDEYFVLGDNSPISADSRIWDPPGISRKSLVGRLLGTW